MTTRIRNTSETVLSPWVRLVEREVEGSGPRTNRVYHSFRQHDYVTVLAETSAGEVALVDQYRAALERRILELPGGLVDSGNDPAASAAQELAEEAGLHAPDGLLLMGTLAPDTGRLENRLWCFHARNAAPLAGWQPEHDMTRVLMPKAEFKALVVAGRFEPALHVAVVGLALLNGRF